MAFVLDVNLRIKDILGLQKAEAALSKLQATTKTGAAAATTGGAGGVAASVKQQAAVATAGAAAVNNLTQANNKLASSQTKATASTKKASSSMNQGQRAAKDFGDSIFLAGKRYASFVAATVVPIAAISSINKATQSVIEFDSAILKLRQITGETEQQIAGIRNTIIDLSTATGTSATELARVGKILAQAGKRGDELTSSLEALSKVPLTPSFESMDTAVEGLLAITNQFNKEALETTEIFDVVTAVSNKFAASAEDIFQGFARGGAAFEAIGGTFREFAAVFTTIREATRESFATVGTFMKTISSRLADPKIVDFLEGKGINIGEAIEAGKPIEAILRIAAGLKKIQSIQDKIEIGTRLGGRRQISRLLALLSNIDKLEKSLSIGKNSVDAFNKVAEVGLEGLQAQLNILSQEFNKLIQTLAEPLFIPIISGVTKAGKAFVSFLDFIKPVIPALTTVIGFAAGFKLLAVSIGLASKAMAGFVSVGVGGGLPALGKALAGAGAGVGGLAGVTARQRIQARLAGGVGLQAGQTAVAGGAAGLVAGGKALAGARLPQLVGFAVLSAAADSLSAKFEETGSAAGVVVSEFTKIAAGLAALTVLFSGKGIVGAFTSIVSVLGPGGAAIAAAIAALATFTYALKKSTDIDIQTIIDEAAQKVADIPLKPIETGDISGLTEAVGEIGREGVLAVSEAAKQYEDGWLDFLPAAYERVKNLFQGEGLVTISDADAQEILETVIGNNPERLNQILQSVVEQFGAAGFEAGLDERLSEAFGGNLELAMKVRQSMVKQLGGMEKIASGIDQTQLDVEVSKLANSIEKASKDFEHLYIPVKLSHQLSLLSDAVGNAAKAIEINVTTFDQLSQLVGQDVGVARPGTEFSRAATEEIVRSGRLGEFMDTSQFGELEGSVQNMAQIGTMLENFIKSIVKSKAGADSLRSLLQDPKIDPFDIIDEYIQQFIDQYPDELPPEAISVFRTGAMGIAQKIRDELSSAAGTMIDDKAFVAALDKVLGKQRPFYEAGIDHYQQWLNSQMQQIDVGLRGLELAARTDISTAELKDTIVGSIQNALDIAGTDIDILPPGYEMGLVDINSAMVDIAQNGPLVQRVMDQYETAYVRQAELLRKITEAQQTGEGATKGLFDAYRASSEEVLNLQVALSGLAKIAQRAPQALSETQAKQRKLGYYFNEKAAAQLAKQVEQNSAQMSEFINRQRQFIEVQAAIDVGQVFEEPAEIFARSLRDSADAVRAFTSALTAEDLQRGAGALVTQTTPENRAYVERQPIPEAQKTEQQKTISRNQLQAALFGADMGKVMEALVQGAVQVAGDQLQSQLYRGDYTGAEATEEFRDNIQNFKGFIYDIPELIKEGALDSREVARVAAGILKEQAAQPGAREVEYIGALKQPITDLSNNIQTLIERPEVGREPEVLAPGLPEALQNYLQQLAPAVDQISEPETAPRIFEDLSTSASDFKIGGTSILTASQTMQEAAGEMQSIIDIRREALANQPGIAAGEVGGDGGTREAITQTTEAVHSLGTRLDTVAKAVETQTKQEAELAAYEREKSLEVEGLNENTNALTSTAEIYGKTRDNISSLNEGVSKMANAIQEGVGIDVETMSQINVDVQAIAAAAKEFTSEFEEVAHRVAKAEIRVILQQLARASSNSETAATFESAVT